LTGKGSNPERIEVKSKLLERVFAVTHQQISEYAKSGMPRIAEGRYDLEACVHWWLERKRAEVESRLDNLEWKEQETRLKRAKASREEMQLEVDRGKLRPVADMEQEYGQLVANCRARLLPIGSTVAPRGIGCRTVAELKKLIDDEIWDALNELSRGHDNLRQDRKDTKATTPVKRKRVGRRKSHSVAGKRGRARAVENRPG